MKQPSDLKVAIVHDWLVGGGAERVVLELHRMFPEAPIYTSYATPEWRDKLDGKVVTGWLQHFGSLRKFLVLGRIWWFTHLNFSGYDLVISSSGNGEAKGIRVPEGTTHVCYCHAPTHYYWRHYAQYMARPGFGVFDPLARLGLKLLVGPLRKWDLRASKRPTYYIANSSFTQSEISHYYNRESVVIHPPVDVKRFERATSTERTGYVTMGRQAPYKHTDLLIRACNSLHVPLSVIGRGPDHAYLQSLAGPTITFFTDVSDAEMPAHLSGAKAFLFAAYEDFGVAPVEAMAAGTPVIAYKAGGALDYVVPHKTGVFFPEQTADSLVAAIKSFTPQDYSEVVIKQEAVTFSDTAFQAHLRAFLATIF